MYSVDDFMMISEMLVSYVTQYTILYILYTID